eukprot:scaffold59586_cov60-Phaeocystis_antarctica.AAC.4
MMVGVRVRGEGVGLRVRGEGVGLGCRWLPRARGKAATASKERGSSDSGELAKTKQFMQT